MHTPPRIHNVRNVAPGKNMYCVSFRVPAEVAYARTPPTERPAVVSDKRIAEAGDDAGEGSIPKKSRS